MIKTVAVLTTAYFVVKAIFSDYMSLMYGPLWVSLSVHWQAVLWVGGATVCIFLFVSIMDVFLPTS
jgi:flagellar biosynthesis protein FlhB